MGMTPEEVMRAEPRLGPPESRSPSFDGTQINEYRSIDLPRFSYEDGRLYDIDTDFSTTGVMLGDLDIYNIDPTVVLKRLFDMNGEAAYLAFDGLFFRSLNVNTGGFYDPREHRFFRLGDDDDTRGLAVLPASVRPTMMKDARPVRWSDLPTPSN